ncbi:MAG: DUF1287 domain-containing protein [Patescibacteria group bacterium]
MSKFRFPNPDVHPLFAIAAICFVGYFSFETVRLSHVGYGERMANAFPKTSTGATATGSTQVARTDVETTEFLKAARAQVGVTLYYDPSYQKLDFPKGDVPKEVGVCSDVVIRAYRGIGVDLQAEVNADMKANFSKYPTKYGLSAPDPNIDHRRVPNLMAYFDRKGRSKPITKNPADYLPGDIVAWKFPRNQTHIGIVSEISDAATGIPYIYSNSGRGTLKEDILFGYEIIGHYGWR